MEINSIKNFTKSTVPTASRSYRFSLMEIVLLIVVLGLFYWFIISPKKAVVAERQEALRALQTRLQGIDSEVKKLEELGALIKARPQDVAMLDEALPLDSRITKLDILVTGFADSSGLTAGDIHFSSAEEKTYAIDKTILADPFKSERTVKKVLGNAYVMGTYPQLKAFLEKIEQSGRLLNVTTVDIAASQDDKYDMHLGLESYYFTP